MHTNTKITLSDVHNMLVHSNPLSIEEYGHCHYDGYGVNKNIEEAYVWYKVAQYSGNHLVDGLVKYLDSNVVKKKSFRLSSRAKHIYIEALKL